MMRWGPIFAAAALLAACGFDTRSDQFACDSGGGCPDGRECVDGWCVVPGGGSDIDAASGPRPDAEPGAIDATPCIAPCTSCTPELCIVDCSGGNACPGEITCPAGMRCEVHCGGVNSCAGGVDCGGATECDVTCDKREACGGGVTCGTGPCDVECSAQDTCLGAVDCSASCACTTSCSGAGACPDLTCPAGDGSCETGGDCNADGACNTCL